MFATAQNLPPSKSSLTAPQLPGKILLSMPQVEAAVGLDESTIRILMEKGEFPRSDFRTGASGICWSAGLIATWLESTGKANGFATDRNKKKPDFRASSKPGSVNQRQWIAPTSPERIAALQTIRDLHAGVSAVTQRRRLEITLETMQYCTTFEASRYLDIYAPSPRKLELVNEGRDIITVWRYTPTESGKLHRIGVYALRHRAESLPGIQFPARKPDDAVLSW